MNRISRIALLCLCFLCIIALAVILATAFFSKDSNTDGNDGAPASDSVSAPSGSPGAAVSPSAAPTPSASPPLTPPDVPDIEGERVSFRAPSSENTFTAVMDTDRFRHSEEGAETFFDTTVDNDRVYIEFCYFADKTAEVSAPSFLDDYVEHTDYNVSGLENIGATGLSGNSVFATDGVYSFEAWLIDENQGGMLAIVMSYSDETQAAALHAIFDSLTLA